MATFDEMAPWDALSWFDTPTERAVVGAGMGTQLCQADPRRVLLGFANPGGAGGSTITTDPATPNMKGIVLGTTGLAVLLNAAWYGPLVQMAWYSNLIMGGVITVYEVKLRDWPISDRQWWDKYDGTNAK